MKRAKSGSKARAKAPGNADEVFIRDPAKAAVPGVLKRTFSMGWASNIVLPKDVMVLLMTGLSIKDLASCARVCKYWNLVTKDESLGWMPLIEIRFTEFLEAYPDSPETASAHPWERPSRNREAFRSNLPAGVEGKSIRVWQSEALKRHPNHQKWKNFWFVEVLSQDGEVIVYARSECVHWVDELPDVKKDPRLWRMSLHLDRVSNLGWDMYSTASWTQKGYLNFTINYELNVRRLERLVRQHESIPSQDFIGHLITHDVQRMYSGATFQDIEFDFAATHVPSRAVVAEPATPGLAAHIKLHKYQRACLSWMYTIEQDENQPFEYCTLAPWKSGRCDVLVDLLTKKLTTAGNAHEFLRKARARGGILADEMGLGKTIEILALMLANPAKSDMADVFTTRGGEKLAASRATLVIGPNHLAAQWQDEIAKNTSPALKIIYIPTIVQLRSKTYADLMDADVIVTTYNVLKSDKYIANSYQLKQRRKDFAIELESAGSPRLFQWSRVDHAFFETIHWHRIVLDEAHEGLAMESGLYDFIPRLSCKYAWYVSGTPFPSPNLFDAARLFLGMSDLEPNSGGPLYMFERYIHSDLMLHNLYWRNTKESAKSDWSIPDTLQELVMLEATPIEAVLLVDAENDPDRQRRICCDLQQEFGRIPLEQIRVQLLKEKKEGIVHLALMIERRKERIKALEEKAAKLEELIAQEEEKELKKYKTEAAREKARAQQAAVLAHKLEMRKQRREAKAAAKKAALQRKKDKGIAVDMSEFEEDDDEEDDTSLSAAEKLVETRQMLEKAQKLLTDSENALTHDQKVLKLVQQIKPKQGGFQKSSLKNDEAPAVQVAAQAAKPEKLITREGESDKEAAPPAEEEKESAGTSTASKGKGRGKKAAASTSKHTKAAIAVEKKRKADEEAALAEKAKKEEEAKKAEEANEDEDEEDDEEEEKIPSGTKRRPAPGGGKKKRRKKARTLPKPKKKEVVMPTIAVPQNEKELEKALRDADAELGPLVEHYGTKLAHLVIWLKKLFLQNKTARAILFSQFTDYLARIGDILFENGIPCVFVEGNIFIKTKALKAFKAEDTAVKVIMLSLGKAAAGTNLMEASHVVLLDPISGTKKEAKAYEAQAIGRAYRQGQKGRVTVVRFIVRKSIEHALYLRNCEEEEPKEEQTKTAEAPAPGKDATPLKRKRSSRAAVESVSPEKPPQQPAAEQVAEVMGERTLAVRTSSISCMLAGTALPPTPQKTSSFSISLERSGSITNILEQKPSFK